MNKLTIPTILAATVMVAGIFAFMPVEQASTVHTSNTITLAANSISATEIANNAIGATEIADAAIDAATYAASAIDAAAIATDAITSAELDDTAQPLNVVITCFDADYTSAPTVTSDKQFYFYATVAGAAGTTLTVADGTNTQLYTFSTETSDMFVFGENGGVTYTLTGSANTVEGYITLITQPGAAADCT